MAITAITSVEQFDELVLGSKELVIVDFLGWLVRTLHSYASRSRSCSRKIGRPR